MTDNNDNENKNNSRERQTISLKKNVDTNIANAMIAKRTFAIEIKKKKQGLNVAISIKNDEEIKKSKRVHAVQSGNLTDKELKTRTLALQNAIKEEEQENLDKKNVELDNIDYENKLSNELEIASQQEKSIEIVERLPINEVKINEANIEKKKKTARDVFKDNIYVANSVAEQENHVIAKTNKEVVEQQFLGKKKEKIILQTKNSYSGKKNIDKKISKASLNRVLNNDFEERMRSEASFKRSRMKLKNADKVKKVIKIIRDVSIPDVITIAELADRMAVQAAEIVKYLMKIGTLTTVNQTIDGETAEIICTDFGHNPKRISDADIENELLNIEDTEENLSLRAPIVAIMGHVDHGKTTLLDTLRKTSVAQKEAGGITQHIASYQIYTKNNRPITFIDTPGHAAFTQIRLRGAVVTDIIVLVVAADDGIKESAIEVIHNAKKNKIPIIVAINKIDKPDINIDKVKTELMNHEIILEDFGGDVLSIGISALKNINLDEFLETILLQAEILELKANYERSAVATVLESRIEHGRGIVVSVIMQSGTLKIGDVFVAGAAFGKVRTIYNDVNHRIFTAYPSLPVEIVGFNSAPNPGDIFTVVESEQQAKEIAEYRARNQKNNAAKNSIKTIDQLISNKKNDAIIVNVIVKADVSGSLEAVVASIEAIIHEEIKVVVVDQAVGMIRESDVEYAKNTGAIVIGFNVGISHSAKNLAKLNKIKILNYAVIYNITKEIKAIMSAKLAPIVEENYIGTAEVRKIFEISRYGTIAGCCVIDGIVKRIDSKIKVKRGKKYIFEGNIKSMKHEKSEIKEAKQNHECGILAEGYNNFQESDLIECYEVVLKNRIII